MSICISKGNSFDFLYSLQIQNQERICSLAVLQDIHMPSVSAYMINRSDLYNLKQKELQYDSRIKVIIKVLLSWTQLHNKTSQLPVISAVLQALLFSSWLLISRILSKGPQHVTRCILSRNMAFITKNSASLIWQSRSLK